MDLHLAADFSVRYLNGETLPTAELHEQGERLMAALLDLEAANPKMSGPATASDGVDGTVTIELAIEAKDFAEAVALADPIMRTAIHAIGGATPNWAGLHDPGTCFEQRGVQVMHA